MCKKSNRQRRAVSFCHEEPQQVTEIPIVPTSSLTDVWFTADDLQTRRQNDDVLVNACVMGTIPSAVCIRGLESKIEIAATHLEWEEEYDRDLDRDIARLNTAKAKKAWSSSSSSSSSSSLSTLRQQQQRQGPHLPVQQSKITEGADECQSHQRSNSCIGTLRRRRISSVVELVLNEQDRQRRNGWNRSLQNESRSDNDENGSNNTSNATMNESTNDHNHEHDDRCCTRVCSIVDGDEMIARVCRPHSECCQREAYERGINDSLVAVYDKVNDMPVNDNYNKNCPIVRQSSAHREAVNDGSCNPNRKLDDNYKNTTNPNSRKNNNNNNRSRMSNIASTVPTASKRRHQRASNHSCDSTMTSSVSIESCESDGTSIINNNVGTHSKRDSKTIMVTNSKRRTPFGSLKRFLLPLSSS